MCNLRITLLLALCASVGEARTIIVAADSTGEFTSIGSAAAAAQAGDSILIRDGTYIVGLLSVDSGVVVFAEHPGGPLVICATAIGITLHQSAQLLGMQIVGDFIPQIMQFLVEIRGGPATIYNCQFWPTARQGLQVSVFASGRAPVIRYCQFFTENGASPILEDWDTTTIYMPYNYYQRTDTVAIHRDIRDASDGFPGHGYVYISPVLDSFEWLDVPEQHTATPATASLRVFPNPFNSTTHLEFTLPSTQRVSLRLYDVLGREVAVLMNEVKAVGRHRLTFDASGLPSGVYLCRLEAGGMAQTRKMVLVK